MTTYFFYTLTNPKNNKVFYVGCTASLLQREKQHSYDSIKPSIRSATSNKDRYILIMGCDPVMEVIDELECEEPKYLGMHSYAARLREAMWIELFLSWGFDLMNRMWLGSSRKILNAAEREREVEQMIYLEDLDAYADGLKKLTQSITTLMSDVAELTAMVPKCIPCETYGDLTPTILKVA